MASSTIKDYIMYYKNKLDRIKDSDEDMILETLHKLAKPPTVTAEIIQDTDILRSLAKLCKRKGKIAEAVLPLFNKWKLVMTIAMNEKEKRMSPPDEEKPIAKSSLGDPQHARGSHLVLDKDQSSHPPHRSRDPHPIKRKDPFQAVAEPKRPTHPHHRERDTKRHTPQKDHPPPVDSKPHQIPQDSKPHQIPRDLKSINPSHHPLPESLRTHHHRSSDSDSDHRGSRHLPRVDGNPRNQKREVENYLAGDSSDHYRNMKRDVEAAYTMDSTHGIPRNQKREVDAASNYLSDSSDHHRNPKRDTEATYMMDSGHGIPRNLKRELEASSHYQEDSGHTLKREQGEAMSHYQGDSAHGNPRNPKRDPEAHWSGESDSDRRFRHPPTTKKDYPADSGGLRNPKKDLGALSHWGKDFKSRKDPERDQPPPKKDYPAEIVNPRNPKKDLDPIQHWGSNYKSRKDLPASETDSMIRDYLADGGNPRNPKKEEATSYREYKARKELSAVAPDVDSSRYSSAQKDLFPFMEGDTSADESNSEQRYPAPKKDYFSVEADTTCPGSRSSEHNGVSNSQDSTNHIDIDSLSNPNLSIDTANADKLNTSEESEPATPTKRTKTLEPYYIEMREGMFRAVKNRSEPFAGGGLKYCELIHRDIIKGNSIYKRDHTKYDEPKKYDLPSPSSDNEKSKNGPTADQKPDKSGSRSKDLGSAGDSRSKHDLKRKSASPCKDRKSARPDSTSDHKLKVKKEVLSPSHLSKPLNNVEAHQSNCDRNKKLLDSPESSAQYISSKKDRRAVYSGRKAAQDISSLKSNCLRVLRKNLDYLRCPMKVPYETLHPILETLNPSQLSKFEEHNKHLMAYTNSLWKQHFNRDCRGQMINKSEKDVIWKEEYNRAQEQQKKRLKSLTASITASASKARPDRQAKVVDSHHDFGGRRGTRTSEVPIPSSKSAAVSPAIAPRLSSSPTPKASSSTARTPLPIISKPKEIKHSSAHKPVKKVVAPLMSKVKKSMANAIVYRQK